MKKKLRIKDIVFIIVINVTLISVVLFSAHVFIPGFLAKARASFLPPEQSIFYRKYALELHHLRDFDFLSRLSSDHKKSKTDFIFSTIGKEGRSILIQGDSWSEQFLFGESSSVLLNIFADTNKVNFVVAGTTSYSPSVMAAQFRILNNDFGIKPTIIVATIDQTDFGDEICRYKSQLSTNTNGDLVIRQYETTKNIPYDVKPYFEYMDLLDKDQSPLVTLWQYGIKKLQKKEDGGCSNEDIMNPLKGIYTQEEKKYFIERVANYISTVLSASEEVQHLLLVTYFHRGHADGTYKTNVGEFLNDAILLSGKGDRVSHLNFNPSDYDASELSTMFKQGDIYSHLTNKAHGQLYTYRILNRIQSLLINNPSVQLKN